MRFVGAQGKHRSRTEVFDGNSHLGVATGTKELLAHFAFMTSIKKSKLGLHTMEASLKEKV